METWKYNLLYLITHTCILNCRIAKFPVKCALGAEATYFSSIYLRLLETSPEKVTKEEPAVAIVTRVKDYTSALYCVHQFGGTRALTEGQKLSSKLQLK